MDKVRKQYSEEVKLNIVSEIEKGEISLKGAYKEYGIPLTVLRDWLNEYGRFKPKQSIVEIVMKSEKDKIREMEQALAEAHLAIRAYEEILRQASKKYKVDLKKTFGNQQCENLKEAEIA